MSHFMSHHRIYKILLISVNALKIMDIKRFKVRAIIEHQGIGIVHLLPGLKDPDLDMKFFWIHRQDLFDTQKDDLKSGLKPVFYA